MAETVTSILVEIRTGLQAIMHDADIVTKISADVGPVGSILKSAGDQIHGNAFALILLLNRASARLENIEL
jgi:hypothetical protein